MNTRWFLIAFAITFIVCLVQALPTPQQETTSQTNQFEDTLKKIGDQLTKGIETFKNDPQFKEALKTGQSVFNEGYDKLQKEASKLFPKTDETTTPAP